jgi:hypothetical protein
MKKIKFISQWDTIFHPVGYQFQNENEKEGSRNSEFWWEYVEIGILLHSCCGWKMMQSLLKIE